MTPTEAALEEWIERILTRVVRPIIREEIRAALRESADHQEAPAEWLDTNAAAKVLGVHRKTVERLARANEIKSARAGRCLRFRRSDIDAYLEGHR